MTEIKELTKKKITELVEVAKELGIDSSGKKDELIQKIIDFNAGNNKENDSKSKSDSKKENPKETTPGGGPSRPVRPRPPKSGLQGSHLTAWRPGGARIPAGARAARPVGPARRGRHAGRELPAAGWRQIGGCQEKERGVGHFGGVPGGGGRPPEPPVENTTK